jgi:pimeloyl-ACP methyl ester carboxylesterase
VNRPDTQYAKVNGLNIAYQVVGDGSFDLLYIPGFVSNVELGWDEPLFCRWVERLTSFCRLITFDKRGTGMSDPVATNELPTLEQRMEDVSGVLAAVGSERVAFLSHSEGGNLAVLFAATYPDRVIALVTTGIFAKRIWSPDYPWAPKPENREAEIADLERQWGGYEWLEQYVPSCVADEAFKRRLANYFRRSASPGAAAALIRMNTQIDVRAVLPSVRCPTVVLVRSEDRDVTVEENRWIASQIPGARMVELPGQDHIPWVGESDVMLDEIQEFLTGARGPAAHDRVLTTLLFVDVVSSTEHLVEVGDLEWRDQQTRFDAEGRRQIERYRGRLIDTAGDGFFASFDGPARAIQAAIAMREGAARDGLRIRAGIHTGEVEPSGYKLTGIAVHVGARILGLAAPNEILISRTVRDLISGSGIALVDRGSHMLKGLPEPWQVYGVAN